MSTDFYPVTHDSFRVGEQWESVPGYAVTIVSVEQHPGATSDYCSNYTVVYRHPSGALNDKDAWSFQVRYTHLDK